MKQGTRTSIVIAVGTAAALGLAACTGTPAAEPAPQPTVTVTVEAEPTPEPTPEPVAVTDPDQVRYYEAMRAAEGWEAMTDDQLTRIAEAACTDLRGYTGAPELAIASMELTFAEELGGSQDLGKAAVSALVQRWCPEILE